MEIKYEVCDDTADTFNFVYALEHGAALLPLNDDKTPSVYHWKDENGNLLGHITKKEEIKGTKSFGLHPIDLGFFVIDIDTKKEKDGLAEIEALCIKYDLRDSWYRRPDFKIVTVNGGLHLYFLIKGIPESFYNKTGVLKNIVNNKKSGIDFKCSRAGYVVCPGSLALDEKGVMQKYEMFGDWDGIAELPEEVINAFIQFQIDIDNTIDSTKNDEYTNIKNAGIIANNILDDAQTKHRMLVALRESAKIGAFDDYDDFIAVGFALACSGYSVSDWESISWPDAPCKEKWNTLRNPKKITAATLFYYARKSSPGIFKKQANELDRMINEIRIEEKNKRKEKEAIESKGTEKSLAIVCPSDIWYRPHTTLIQKTGDVLPLATIQNFEILVKYCGIEIYENMMKHDFDIVLPYGRRQEGDIRNYAISVLKSLVIANRFSKPDIQSLILSIAHKNQRHPMKEFIESSPWDGQERLVESFDYLDVSSDDQDQEFCLMLWRKWLLSQIAVLYEEQNPRARGVLTLQGKQSTGKTSFFRSLYPSNCFKDGVSINVENKDDRISSLSFACCELGEIEGVFRKSDIAALKAFLSLWSDRYRKPYAAEAEEHPRRTIFCASVNDSNFLNDHTGSSRFWIIKTKSPHYKHKLDVQQLWAEMKVKYLSIKENNIDFGWWLTPGEESVLGLKNKEHEDVSLYAEKIMKYYDTTKKPSRIINNSDIAREIGIDRPTPADVRQINNFLKSYNRFAEGRTKSRSRGWEMPFPRSDDELRFESKIESVNLKVGNEEYK